MSVEKNKVTRIVASAAGEAAKARAEWDEYGDSIGKSRWFNRAPNLALIDNVVVWQCPTTGCGGHMEYTGDDWCTSPLGRHHQCNACGFTAAIKGALFNPIDQDDE